MKVITSLPCLALTLCISFQPAKAAMLTRASAAAPAVPAVIVVGASIGSGQWPVLRRRFGLQLSNRSETTSIPGYFGLGTVLAERAQGNLQVFTLARAGTTSYDLPNAAYDAVGDGSLPFWPSLKRQFDAGYQYSLTPGQTGLTATATHLVITLPDDCYFVVDFAVPSCVPRMISNTERAVQAARTKGLNVIVELQNDLADLNIEGLPGLITVAQYEALRVAWDHAFRNRESEGIYTINLYQGVVLNKDADLLDGINHLSHAAMVRAADKVLELIMATPP